MCGYHSQVITQYRVVPPQTVHFQFNQKLKRARVLKSTYPVHTLHLHAGAIIMQLRHMLVMTITYTYEASWEHEHILLHAFMHNVYGYDDQHKCTICDTCRPCNSILNILKPAFHWNRQICCIYNSFRCLDLQIWQFLCSRQPQQRQRQQNWLLYPLHIRVG